jgi:hypothetical protein
MTTTKKMTCLDFALSNEEESTPLPLLKDPMGRLRL